VAGSTFIKLVAAASSSSQSWFTPRAADKIYDKIITGPNGLRLRQGEKVVGLCRKVWRIMRRLHPELFDRKHPNPWHDFTLKSRTKNKKHAVSREEFYKFAWGCIKEGQPEPAAVSVICFDSGRWRRPASGMHIS